MVRIYHLLCFGSNLEFYFFFIHLSVFRKFIYLFIHEFIYLLGLWVFGLGVWIHIEKLCCTNHH